MVYCNIGIMSSQAWNLLMDAPALK